MLWLLVLLAATSAAPDDPLAEVVSSAEVRAALRDAEARRERFVDEWIRIAQIPAPSGAEGERAAHLEERFRAAGFSGVARDAAGNVLALLAGRDPDLKRVAFVAHLDTVAPADADHTVRRRPEGRLEGPGVRDDSSGLAGLLAAAELMKRHRLVPPADTWFVAS
ncbi:MAG TPA: M20/M25/M40 family metallo-hydrolase, partial [Candidatus Polarisedimenticolia bacterium]|nr:M20/M25/M40 family metallo-hydrolase [Candidatus Polarisedimenticolia bacterium]